MRTFLCVLVSSLLTITFAGVDLMQTSKAPAEIAPDAEKAVLTGKITFEAGKVYYLLRKAVPGGAIMTTQTPDDFKKYLQDRTPEFLSFAPQGKKVKVIKPERIADARKEFEEGARKDPGKHADVLNYKGY